MTLPWKRPRLRRCRSIGGCFSRSRVFRMTLVLDLSGNLLIIMVSLKVCLIFIIETSTPFTFEIVYNFNEALFASGLLSCFYTIETNCPRIRQSFFVRARPERWFSRPASVEASSARVCGGRQITFVLCCWQWNMRSWWLSIFGEWFLVPRIRFYSCPPSFCVQEVCYCG